MIFRIIKNLFGIQILLGLALIVGTFADNTTNIGPVSSNSSEMFNADTYISRFFNYQEHVLLIDSPGGSGSAALKMVQTISEMKSNGTKVVTKVDSLAASAGAILFMQGDIRIMSPTATIVLHGAHFGGYGLTQATLGHAKEFIDSGKFDKYIITGKVDSVEDVYALSTIGIFIQDPATGLAGVRHTINSAYMSLKKLNDEMVRQVTIQLNKLGKRTWTEQEVQKELFADFKDDVIISADKAIELGIATHIER